MKEKIKLNFKTIKKFENHDVLSYPCVIQIKSCATYCRPNVLDTRIIVLNDMSIYPCSVHNNAISFGTVPYSRRRMTLDTVNVLCWASLKTLIFLRLVKMKLQYFPADTGQNDG